MWKRPKEEPITMWKRPHNENCMCNEPTISPGLRKAIRRYCQLEHNHYIQDFAKHVTEKAFKWNIQKTGKNTPYKRTLKEMRRVLVANDTYFLQRCYDCRGHTHSVYNEHCHP